MSPFKDLAGRAVTVGWNEDLPDGLRGMSAPDPDRIALSRGMTQVERRCVLSHELVHIERGGGSEHPDPIVRAREEMWVDRIVADRLVPEDELGPWLARQEDPVTVADVCEQWRVTPEYATIALRRRDRSPT